jgi:hypothetical protein
LKYSSLLASESAGNGTAILPDESDRDVVSWPTKCIILNREGLVVHPDLDTAEKGADVSGVYLQHYDTHLFMGNSNHKLQSIEK